MLLEVKKFMAERYVANLEQVAAHIHQDPAFTRQLLDHWVRKGKLEKLPQPAGCGTKCLQCRPKFAEVYKYIAPTSSTH